MTQAPSPSRVRLLQLRGPVIHPQQPGAVPHAEPVWRGASDPFFHDDDDDEDGDGDEDEDEDDDRGLSPRGSGEVRRRYCTRCASRGSGVPRADDREAIFSFVLILFVIGFGLVSFLWGKSARARARAAAYGDACSGLDALLRQQSGSWRKTV